MNVIELRGVSKKYPIYDRTGDRLKELLTFNRLRFHREYWALRDISLDIERGETFCIIGENGSGKSTLLQLIVGILRPTMGTVKVQGRTAALLELGTGFNPEFTGRENVFLNGTILGLSTHEIARKLDEILEFAEIGSYIDQPVKTCSSGMVVRLAFSVAVHLEPEILIVDEALAVGDIYFRQRCMRKIHELRSRGVTIVYVSHDIGDVKALGHRTLWLQNGRVADLGDTNQIAVKYLAELVRKDALYLRREHAPASHTLGANNGPKEIITTLPAGRYRHGDGRAEVIGISVVNERGQVLDRIQSPARIVVRISVRAKQEIRLPIVGVQLRTEQGVDFAGTNTSREGIQLPAMPAGEVHTVDFHLHLPELNPSWFTFTPAIAEGTLAAFELCDMVEDAVRLPITANTRPVDGYMHLSCPLVTFARCG